MEILTIRRASSVRIEWCRDEAVPEVQAFLDAHWRRGHVLARDARLLRWQFAVPGDPERVSVLVARRGGDILGMLGVIRAGFCDRGKRLEAGWLANWVVPAEQRPSGAGLHLLRRAIDEFDVIGTLGGNATTLKILGTLGFETRPAMPRWVRVLDRDALDRILAAAGDPRAHQQMTRWIDRGGAYRPVCPTRHDLRVMDWQPSLAGAWDVCWDGLAAELCGTWRDSHYIRRRYVEHPSFEYRVRIAAGNGRACGLLVYRVVALEERDVCVLRVVDFLTGDDGAVALANDLASVAEQTGAAYADFYCPSSVAGRQLAAAGFVRAEGLPIVLPGRFQPLDFRWSGLSVAVRSRDAEHRLFDRPSLYLTSSDCDQDRPN